MGRFFQDAETVRVTFPDGEWVDVKEELSQADQDYVLNQMAQAELSDKSSDVKLRFGKLALLERGIVAWSFAEDCKPIPITPDTISRLRLRYRSPVLKELDRLDKAALEFLRKN